MATSFMPQDDPDAAAAARSASAVDHGNPRPHPDFARHITRLSSEGRLCETVHDNGNPRPHPDFARHITRLLQCRLCAIPYKLVVTLPCGRSICRSCLPPSYVRDWITYPSAPDRHQVIQCPFPDCGRVHAVKDCSSDVTLNKLATMVHSVVARAWTEAASLGFIKESPVLEPMPEIPDDYEQKHLVVDTRFLATWFLATQSLLDYDDEFHFHVTHGQHTQAEHFDIGLLQTLQQTLRSEVDCQICFSLLYDPFTTPCGHTFCRHCLMRAYDRRECCPLCRRPVDIDRLLKPDACPSNDCITGLIRTFWQDEVDARKEAFVAEGMATRHLIHIPLLVCGLSFPGQPMYVQIFEPQYHRMLENVLNGNGKFGMVMPLDPERLGDGFHPIGILLQIKNTWYRQDGRSLVELEGLSRFRVLNWYTHEGYTVGVSERADDVGVEQEEAMEAAEVGYDASDSAAGGHLYQFYDTRDEEAAATAPFWTSWRQFGSDMPESAVDLDAMTTESLMRFALSFVDRTREKKVPWLTEAKLMTYGECPDDPVLLPWWFGSTIPISNPQKVRLISAFTVRDRLKICGSWILEMRRRTRYKEQRAEPMGIFS
ncbi:hypothetical protein L249_2958 [Ophiocordyceps polyrhachis-furcata BCC 54312]|uniref:RING-type domain-containing protein n=1 Tax=Ophiocordyceps polyrhachis-furcata BCC 54312 TaxID=1330021 RepID=A0A367LN14_9HYPO|nr:hypothetical protein L249_2958 [Ophiocordyceps polyrhachis-furcata BCC 54312]